MLPLSLFILSGTICPTLLAFTAFIAVIRAFQVAEIIDQADAEEIIGIVVVGVAALAALFAELTFIDTGNNKRAVREGGGNLAAIAQQVAFIGVNRAHIVEIIGKQAAAAEFDIDAPGITEVDFHTQSVHPAAVDGKVFLSFKLPLGAQWAQLVQHPVELCFGVEIHRR